MARGIGLMLVAPTLCLVLSAADVFAWDNEFGHDRLTIRAVKPIEVDLANYVHTELGFDGRETAFQLGLDGLLDEDARGGAGPRFEAVLVRDRHSPPVIVTLNEAPSSFGPSFLDCFAAKKRELPKDWIRLGAFAEDNPNSRSQHHFHDPVFDHGSPTGNHGLNDDRFDDELASIHLPVTLDNLINDYGVLLTGRGHNPLTSKFGYVATYLGTGEREFDLKGRSAPDRALNRPIGTSFPSGETPENVYSLADSERYLFRALTSPYQDQREHYASAHLIGVGHALHLLQDMGSAGHARNDFLIEHLLRSPEIQKGVRVLLLGGGPILATHAHLTPPSPPNIDEAPLAGDGEAAASVDSHLSDATLERSLPQKFLDEHPALSFSLGSYPATTPLPSEDTLLALEISDLWDQGSQESPTGLGFAEFTNTHFLSAGTRRGEYSLPAISNCKELGTPGQGVWNADLPGRNLITGEAEEPGRFLSSPVVPHLAQCRSVCQGFARALVPDSLCVGTPSDESVLRDYVEITWAYAIRYGKVLLQKLLTPRIDVIPIGQNRFKLANLTQQELRFDPSAISIWYDTPEILSGTTIPRRVEVPVSCGTAELVLSPAPVGQSGPVGDFICELPTGSIPLPARRDDFFVVARGKWGEFGNVGTPSDLEDAPAYAVAFRRVLGRRLLITSAPSGENDEEVVNDVVLAEFSVGGEVLPALPEPPFRLMNLTRTLRDQLGTAARVDFDSPSAEFDGTRFAFGGDSAEELGNGSLAPSEFWLGDLAAPGSFNFLSAFLPPGPVTDNFEGGPKWDTSTGSHRFAYSGAAEAAVGGMTRVVRFDVDTGSASVSSEETEDIVAASKGELVVAIGDDVLQGPELFLVDPSTGKRTHRFLLRPSTGAPRVHACPEPENQACIELDQTGGHGGATRDPGFAPGTDDRIAFAGQVTGDSSFRLYVADLGGFPGSATTAITEVEHAGELSAPGSVAWSQDGFWIAYQGLDGIYVVSAPGAAAQPIGPIKLPFQGHEFSWAPDLLLPGL